MMNATLRQGALFLFLLALGAGASHAQTVTIEDATTSPSSSTVSVPVKVSNVNTDLSGIQFVVTFDGGVIDFRGQGNTLGLSNVIGGRGGDFSTSRPSPGELRVVFSDLSNPINVGGSSGVLFELEFDVLSKGNSPLSFDTGNSFLADAKGNNLGPTFQNGSVTVTAAPTASFTFSPTTPDVGETVSFDASSSSDSDGSISSYEWDFDGDGTTDKTGQTASTSFSSEGGRTVTLTVTDNDGVSSSTGQTVTVVNEPPAVDENEGLVVDIGKSKTITTSELSASDPDDGPSEITYTVTSVPSQGDLLVGGTPLSSGGTFTQKDLADGDVAYKHTAGNASDDSFTFDLRDPEGEGPSGTTFSITVNGPPVVDKNAGLGVITGETKTITTSELSASDPDPGNGPSDLTYTVTSVPSQGDLLVGGTPLSSGGTFTQKDLADGDVAYKHTAGNASDDSFTFDLTDPRGLGPSGKSFDISVTANRPPTAQGDDYTAIGGNVLQVTRAGEGVLGNDSDPDGDPLTASLQSRPDRGSLTFNSDGTFDYGAPEDFVGDVSFTYQVSDGQGGTDQATATISVKQSPNPPTAKDDDYSTTQGEDLRVGKAGNGVLGNDSDPDGNPLTASVVDPTDAGDLSFNSDGTFTYRPNDSFSGIDKFVYQVSDGTGWTDRAEVSITVRSVNQAPSISDIGDQTIQEDKTTGTLTFTVSDPETAPSGLSLSGKSSNEDLVPSSHLELEGPDSNGEGQVKVVPRSDSNGTATISVTVSDGSNSTTESFKLKVNPVNDAPSVLLTLPDNTLSRAGPPMRLTGLRGNVFKDPDEDQLSFTASSSNPSVLSVQGGKKVILQPQSEGTAEVTLTAEDKEASVSADPFTVTVTEQTGKKAPSERVAAAIGKTDGSVTAGFGKTGAGLRLKTVRQGGIATVNFFSGGDGGSSVAATSADSSSDAEFDNVSPYRWEIDVEGVQFDSVDVRFELDDEDVTGIGDPETVTIITDSTGNGTFEAVSTRFDDGGTPSDPSDDALVAEDLTSLSTFKLASNSSQNPLPVELTNFEVTLAGSAAVLSWRTASETDNAGFRVQHRPPKAKGYRQVGFVEGAGTTTTSQRYRFRVPDLKPGQHRFRLQQVDTDGTTTLTNPITLSVDAKRVLALKLNGPNPVREGTQVAFTVKKSGSAKVALFNMLGRRVRVLFRGKATVGQRRIVGVPASTLPSGPYFVRLSGPTGTRTRKIVVVH